MSDAPTPYESIEPVARAQIRTGDTWDRSTAVLELSIAISLKRIADVVEKVGGSPDFAHDLRQIMMNAGSDFAFGMRGQ